MKKAFTMIELIFVIVVLGILAGIAVPRLAATRDDATIAKMRGDLAAIRSGISLKRSQNMMRGDTKWPELETGKYEKDASGNIVFKPDTKQAGLFAGITQNPIKDAGQGARNGWHKTTVFNEYDATVGGKTARFKYYPTGDSANGILPGTFRCESGACNLFGE